MLLLPLLSSVTAVSPFCDSHIEVSARLTVLSGMPDPSFVLTQFQKQRLFALLNSTAVFDKVTFRGSWVLCAQDLCLSISDPVIDQMLIDAALNLGRNDDDLLHRCVSRKIAGGGK